MTRAPRRRSLIAHFLAGVAMLGVAAAIATASAPAAFAAGVQAGSPPVSAIVLVATGDRVAGRPIAFRYTSAQPLASPTWTFGDGIASTLERPTHTYASKGSYTVTLTGGDAARLPATMTVAVLESWTGAVQLYQAGHLLEAGERCAGASPRRTR